MHPIETSNVVELKEVAKRLEMCTLLVERLNQILSKQLQIETKTRYASITSFFVSKYRTLAN
ncbi:hypothetical protein GCM10020331_040090 [Ectobacillus funiculus]